MFHILLSDPILAYAKNELSLLLTEAEVSSDFSVYLTVDKTLPASAYRMKGENGTLHISGDTPSAVLCGVYEALTEGGFCFHANGHFLVHPFDTKTFLSLDKTVKPHCRMRGIRQHINFPMDISGYTLDEARDYIRNIARMRFNTITFHSYRGQWHPTDPKTGYAGHFFYGQRHDISDDPSFPQEKIRNKKTFCIPEIEADFDNEEKRGKLAEQWLALVMHAAKEAYLSVTLSVELPFDEPEKNAGMLRYVLKCYPEIDTIELISYEDSSGENLHIPTSEMPAYVKENLDLTEDDCRRYAEYIGDDVPDKLYGGVEFAIRARKTFACRDTWLPKDKTIALRAGLYITDGRSVNFLMPILMRFFPKDTFTLSLLCCHGASAVAWVLLDYLSLPKEIYERLMVYTWAEFDGNMFLLQQSCNGIGRLSAEIPENSFGFCINHWRTAENGVAIAYAAETAIRPTEPDAYYRKLASILRIEDTNGFSALLRRLASLDTYLRDHLFNIGFSHLGCWCAPSGMNKVRGYETESIDMAENECTALASACLMLSPKCQSKEGKELLALYENRLCASVEHLRVIRALRTTLTEPTGSMTKQEQIDAAFSVARYYAARYLKIYSQIMPDRGCEGQLMSYEATIFGYIKFKYAELTGKPDVRIPSFDEPAPLVKETEV